MIQRTLGQIQEMVGGSGLPPEAAAHLICGVSIDTRTLEPQNLYIPIRGERFNGHAFLERAIAGGAKAALWSRDEEIPNVSIPLIFVPDTLLALQQLAQAYRQQLKTKVIGITGSNGKTSTKDILTSLLATTYRTQKTKGNLNNHLGVPLTLLHIAEDTELAVIEMGMSGLGEIKLLSTIAAPDMAVITNIGETHLDFLQTKENILQAKLEILAGLRQGGLLVYNHDDPFLYDGVPKEVAGMSVSNKAGQNIRLVAFGLSTSSQLYPISFNTTNSGSYFRLSDPASPELFLPLLGRHQLMNALGAITIALDCGVSYKAIQEGLNSIEESGMRNEVIQGESFTIINDAYKSNPTSLRAALSVLYSLSGYNSKVIILGDMNGMGHDEIRMHEQIGEVLDPQNVDFVFTYGPLAQHIAKAAKSAFPKNTVFACLDKTDLFRKVLSVLDEGALVLIKGSRENQLETLVEQLQKVQVKRSSSSIMQIL